MGLLLKRKLLVAAFIALFLSSILAGPQFISEVKAETLGPVDMSHYSGNVINIASPRNETYNSSSVMLSFTGETYYSVNDVGYSLDEGAIERVTKLATIQVPAPEVNIICVRITYMGALFISNLSDGKHSITVYQGYQYRQHNERYEVYAYSNVNFTIDTTAPNISILSPQNTTYEAANVTLNFAVAEAASQISYVLDGGENLTAEGNTTLTGLSNGEHNVTVYVTDFVGNIGASETRYFNVEVPELSPTVPIATASVVAAVVATAVVVVAGLLVYFKKRKR